MGLNSIKIRNHITICLSYKIFSANGQYVLCKCTDQFSAPLSRNVKNVFGRPTVMFYFLLVKVQLYMWLFSLQHNSMWKLFSLAACGNLQPINSLALHGEKFRLKEIFQTICISFNLMKWIPVMCRWRFWTIHDQKVLGSDIRECHGQGLN